MVTASRQGDVLVLQLDDDDNRLTPAALDGWESALAEAEADLSVTALVTTGSGKFYSNGLHLETMAADPGPYIERVVALLGRLLTLPVATVAAVNGHAFGAGAMLVCCHDAAVMREDRGYWCLPEVDLGMPFTPFMQSLVLRTVGTRTARHAMTTGHRYGGPEALAAGIVDAVAAESDVLSEAVIEAGRRGGKDRSALGRIKADLHREVMAPLQPL